MQFKQLTPAMKTYLKHIFLLGFILFSLASKAAIYITVAIDGSGDFKTISAAIASLPLFNCERAVIFVKNGTYNEKIRIDQDYITLQGESKENTIIKFNQTPEDQASIANNCEPAVVNINGDDIILDNLTIENTQPKDSPNAFAIFGRGTRIITINCNFLSKGGNAVSLWNYKNGLYYHAYCNFTGGADVLCPRGWCFVRNSKFFEVYKESAIWHSGVFDKDQKLVIWNSTFDGIRGFELGQRQTDAQLYLLYCTFTDSLANKPILLVESKDSKAKQLNLWGDRYYFYECRGAHVNYDWHKNNLETAQKRLTPTDITSTWTFDGKWDPESKEGPKIVNNVIKDNTLLLTFNEPITLKGLPTLKSRSGRSFNYDSGAGSNTLKFNCDVKLYKEDVKGLKYVNDGRFIGTLASVAERVADLTIK